MNLIEQVKASVALQGFLEGYGRAEFRHVAGNLRSDTCPCCGEGKKGSNKLAIHPSGMKWRCFSCGKGGDVIDAAALIWGISHRDALHRLAKEQWVDVTAPIPPRPQKSEGDKERQEALKEALKRLQRAAAAHVHEDEVVNYLIRDRGIPGRIIAQAQAQGMLGFLPKDPLRAKMLLEDRVGKDLMIRAGLWNPEKKMPGVAYRPIIFFMPGLDSAEFRLARKAGEGERKAIRYGSASRPWYWSGEDGSRLAVVEGAIDLLSLVALGFKGDVVGIPGASVWRPEWFAWASRVYTCLDPDKAGRIATQRIIAACERMGIEVIDKSPVEGDVNDILRSRMNEQRMARAA
jgi:DNA primase